MVQPTVYVGMSGGVDSSVAALRLKNQGYNVVGVFIKVWHPDWLVCNWVQERLDAMRVAAHLDIPFLTCDATQAYRDQVATYFIAEYTAGRTPNPDVMCNQYVKFGAFIEFAKKRGADFVATGHYAQKIITASGPQLYRGVDVNKDQSYFLWTLTRAQLEYSLFPVGDTPKSTIRKEAVRAKLPVATKKDSQGVCFLGHIDIPEFLRHYTTLTPGPVLDKTGAVIGTHQGALVYTLGQRHGFSITQPSTTRPQLYVVAKDIDTNTITVAPEKPHLPECQSLTLSSIVLRRSVTRGEMVIAQFRYRQVPVEVVVIECDDATLKIQPTSTTEQPAAGQSCVLYDGHHCIGGGIIE